MQLLSRDYASAFIPHVDTFKSAIKSADSDLQSCGVIVLGNVGIEQPQRQDEFIDVIEHAVTDPDSEVQRGAAIALGKLPSSRSIQLLEQLAENSDPAVRKQATRELQQLKSELA